MEGGVGALDLSVVELVEEADLRQACGRGRGIDVTAAGRSQGYQGETGENNAKHGPHLSPCDGPRLVVRLWEKIYNRGGMNAQAASAAQPVVRAEGVRKSFGENVVLDGIDLSVAAGETLVVIGPSGSGKSTLLRCINLLEPIDSGRIWLEDEEITAQRREGLSDPTADRDRLPAVQPLPAPQGDRQRDACGQAGPPHVTP